MEVSQKLGTYLYPGKNRTNVSRQTDRIDAYGLNTNVDIKEANKDFVAALCEAGCEFYAWTINDHDRARRFGNLQINNNRINRTLDIHGFLSGHTGGGNL